MEIRKKRIVQTLVMLSIVFACTIGLRHTAANAANPQDIPPQVQQLINQAFQLVKNTVIKNAEKVQQWKNDAMAAAQKTAEDFTGCPSPAAQSLYNDLKTKRTHLNQVIMDATAADAQATQARQTCRNTVPNTPAFKAACDAAYNNLPFSTIKGTAQAALATVNTAITALKNLKCVSGCSQTASMVFPAVNVTPGPTQSADITVCTQWEPGQFNFNANSGNGELSASVLAKLPKCKQTQTYRLAGCEWKLDVILNSLKSLKIIPPEVTLPQFSLNVPAKSVQIINGFNQSSCSQPFKVCTGISGSAKFEFQLGSNPLTSLQNAMQSVASSCTQQTTVGCLNPPFGISPTFATVQIPDPTRAQIRWTASARLKPGSISFDLTKLGNACNPRPLKIPGLPVVKIGKQVVNFPFLCLQPQLSNLVANQ